MIPWVVAPLKDLSVLVTRPQPQASALATSIVAHGGDAIVFPAIAIEPLGGSPPGAYDLVVFVSVNAVEHGAKLIEKTSTTRIAAIGKATAAALAAAKLPADIVPATGFRSEDLLAHPDFAPSRGQRALIVRGNGGREFLRETLTSQGLSVDTLEVYRRSKPPVSDAEVATLESRWLEEGIDVVTATSVQTVTNLFELLSERGRELLRQTAMLAPSRRIIDAASALGWHADAIVSIGADDDSVVGALSNWRARARARG